MLDELDAMSEEKHMEICRKADELQKKNLGRMKIRDEKTKQLFIKYLEEHSDERFMQAVRNFTLHYLDEDAAFICSSFGKGIFKDTYYWECDEMMKEKE